MADGFWQGKVNAERYNNCHAISRSGEIPDYLSFLELAPSDRFVDFGCGKGDFLAQAAEQVAQALGIDATPHQIELARQALRDKPNVELIQADLATWEPGDRAFTKGSARKSLHHLTDEKKEVFFERMGRHFVEGGLFLIEDGMFPFRREELSQRMKGILIEAAAFYRERWPVIERDFISCHEEEFPTGIEALEGFLHGGGFEILFSTPITSFYGRILARKNRKD
ncbi:MAG TPA: hypothetical protein DD435_01220 [Cyanobacteria bacterium UBA8530]|nr:hypothetical protein [Cyanobacteria bacterium UBA8530]